MPPNGRVQRTRPCASLRGSPLTRHPLDRPSEATAVLVAGQITTWGSRRWRAHRA
jgi:hypothetical protein